MKIIQPTYEIVHPNTPHEGTVLLRQVEKYARVSHRSEDAQTHDSWKRFIGFVVCKKGDWSVTEHVNVTAIVRIDRGCTHEIVRHRIGSYTQESTRFCNYGNKDVEFIEPVFTKSSRENHDHWYEAMLTAEFQYKRLLEDGEPPDMARSVLPNATASTIIITYNLRSWRQFFMMRTTAETHRDLRRVSIPLLAKFKENIPLLYDDLEPELKQSISLSRPR